MRGMVAMSLVQRCFAKAKTMRYLMLLSTCSLLVFTGGVTGSGTTTSNAPAASKFTPKLYTNLNSAIDVCLRDSPKGDCDANPNGPMREWDMSKMRDLRAIFMGAASFNGDISKWDVSHVTDMSGMFESATSFNGDISTYDTSSCRDMSSMFFRSTNFNGDITRWDVSSVTDMHSMFMSASSFNRDVSHWDVSNVVNMDTMFMKAVSFSQRLCGAAWVNSRSSKMCMFCRSRGVLSTSICATEASVTTAGKCACSET